MRRNRIWYGTALAAALVIYLIANSGEALAFLLGMLVIPIFIAVVQAYAMRGFQVECECRESCRVSREVPFTIKIHRNDRIPMGLIEAEIVYENIMYGEKRTEIVRLQSCEKRDMKYIYKMLMSDCGNVRITLAGLKCYDKLGLFCWNQKTEQQSDILVYPAQIRINTDLSGRAQTTISGELYDQTRKGQDVSEVFGLRDYAEGDPLGSIHWKLSSKIDDLVVREFAYPSNYNILILYDMMKECGEEKIANQRNNAVLALVSALSYSMIERNLEHDVGRIYAGQYQKSPVYSVSTHEQMLLNLLCRPVSEKERKGDSLHYLLHSNLKNQYTKILYITPEYEEEQAKQLAREVDMTVIQTVQGSAGSWTDSAGYTVIPVNADDYIEKVHNIVI